MRYFVIYQLDGNGKVYRSFTRQLRRGESESKAMDKIARAFNMEHTRVEVFDHYPRGRE